MRKKINFFRTFLFVLKHGWKVCLQKSMCICDVTLTPGTPHGPQVRQLLSHLKVIIPPQNCEVSKRDGIFPLVALTPLLFFIRLNQQN